MAARRTLPIAYLLFASVALLVSVAAVCLGWQAADRQRQLLRDGTAVSGVVTERLRRPGLRGGDLHLIRYAYEDPRGERHRGEVELGSARWEQLPVGAQIALVYLPTEPSIHVSRSLNDADANRPLREAWGFAAATLGSTGLMGVLICFVARKRRFRIAP